MDVNTTSQKLQSRNILDNAYVMYVILEGELSSAEMKAAIGNKYGKLQLAFNNFQSIMKNNLPATKSICKRQATLMVFKVI